MPIPAGPSPSVPSWAPSRQQVAAYVPRRTLVGNTDGHGDAALTFDSTTYPTGPTVDSLIADACAWVLTATGALDATLETAAAAIAAKHAAGYVELGYPDNRDDLSDVKWLLEQAATDLKSLAAANIAITADDPSTSADSLLPAYSFPSAPTYGDYVF